MYTLTSFLISFLTFSQLSAVSPPEKVYVDLSEVDISQDRFRIHTGHNVWIETDTMHRDLHGMYTFELNIMKSHKTDYDRQWKCPYCYNYWPVGTRCQNANCPSKY